MKGYIDDCGRDRPACVTCKYRDRPSTYVACYNCIPTIDIALHKLNCETEFVNYEPDGTAEQTCGRRRAWTN